MFIHDTASSFEAAEKPATENSVSFVKGVLAVQGRRLWDAFWKRTEARAGTDTTSFEGIL